MDLRHPVRASAPRRVALSLAAILLAFGWSGTGTGSLTRAVAGGAHPGSDCRAERGLDPLDVLIPGVRDNVWIVLDTSGSMNDRSSDQTATKLEVAAGAIRRLMDELVDGAGRPLVNWGFAHYDVPLRTGVKCPGVPPDLNGDGYPDEPNGCSGLSDQSFVTPEPGTCSQDTRPDVRRALDSLNARGGTPIGVAFTDMAAFLTGQHRANDMSVTPNRTNFVEGLLPNQKNVVVFLTDGQDTCECEAGGYARDSAGALVSPVSMRPSEMEPGRWVSSVDGSDIASYNAGLKGEFALTRIDPTLDGSKGSIFVVGLDIDDARERDRINTIAWMASGADVTPRREPALVRGAVFADAEGLADRLRDIIATRDVGRSELTLGAPIVTSVKEVIHSHTGANVSRETVIPADTRDPEAIRRARAVRADHRNNVLFTTSVEIPGYRGHLRAVNLYRVADPSAPRISRHADFTSLWDAGLELQDDDPDERTLFFNRRGSTELRPFDRENVSPADLGVSAGFLNELDGAGARTDEDARDIVVSVLRGYRLSIHPATRTLYDTRGELNLSKTQTNGEPTWKLWESTAGAVAVSLNPSRSADFDPPLNHGADYGVGGSREGDGFFWDHINRRTVVYYAASSGILHAFDAETGKELFGFLPDDVVGLAPGENRGGRHLVADFVRNHVGGNGSSANRRFLLASPPVAADVFLRSDSGRGGDDAWHTLLAFGRGRGGRFITALDVTTAPGDPNTLALRWNRGNREGLSDGDLDGLGETWSVPAFGNVATTGSGARSDQWLVFAGGGYGCGNDAGEGRFLYAFRAEDGAIYYRGRVASDEDAAIPQNALVAPPTLYRPHGVDTADGKDFVTRVYIPDLQGRVWKLDTSELNPDRWTLVSFAEMGLDHPITAAVTLLNDAFRPDHVYVMAGSGGDRRAPEPDGGFQFRVWEDVQAEGQNVTRFLPADEGAYRRALARGERVFAPAVTAGTVGDPLSPVVFYAASTEHRDPARCEVSFSSALFAVEVSSELRAFPIASGPWSSKVQGLTVRDGNLYVAASGSLRTPGTVALWGNGDFRDEASAGFGPFTLQLHVEGFRASPF